MGCNMSFWVCLSAAPDGPPMDVTLQPMTSQSIQVTWKVSGAGAFPGHGGLGRGRRTRRSFQGEM